MLHSKRGQLRRCFPRPGCPDVGTGILSAAIGIDLNVGTGVNSFSISGGGNFIWHTRGNVMLFPKVHFYAGANPGFAKAITPAGTDASGRGALLLARAKVYDKGPQRLGSQWLQLGQLFLVGNRKHSHALGLQRHGVVLHLRLAPRAQNQQGVMGRFHRGLAQPTAHGQTAVQGLGRRQAAGRQNGPGPLAAGILHGVWQRQGLPAGPVRPTHQVDCGLAVVH